MISVKIAPGIQGLKPISNNAKLIVAQIVKSLRNWGPVQAVLHSLELKAKGNHADLINVAQMKLLKKMAPVCNANLTPDQISQEKENVRWHSCYF